MTRRRRYRTGLTGLPPLRRKPARRGGIRSFGSRFTPPRTGKGERTQGRPWLPILASALVLLLVVGAGSWLILSDVLYVDEIVVEGNQAVSREEIVEASRIRDVNIFFVQAAAAAAAVKKLPLILDAQVSTSLPNHVSIRVTERQQRITLQAGNVQFAVDGEGVVLPTAPVSDTRVIRLQGGYTPQTGDKLPSGTVETAESLWELRPDVPDLVYAPERGIGLLSPQGWMVYVGTDATKLSDQLALLDRLTPQLQARASQIDYVDLRFPAHPYLKER